MHQKIRVNLNNVIQIFERRSERRGDLVIYLTITVNAEIIFYRDDIFQYTEDQ